MTYSGYFLGCPWLHLTGVKDAKDVDVMGTCIGSLFIERAFVEPFSVASSLIGISIELSFSIN